MTFLRFTGNTAGRAIVRTITLATAILVCGSEHPIAMQASAIPLRRHHVPIQIHRHRDQTVSESYNWSGYAVTGANGSVSDVTASWTVPSVAGTCASVPEGYASFWTGIDGWNSNSVEQIGTDSDCVNLQGTKTGTPTYYAWFEFYPQDAFLIGTYSRNGTCESGCVSPGDTISAEVKFIGNASSGRHSTGGPQFAVTINDETKGWSFTTTSTVSAAKQSSAEWIAESPYGCRTPGHFCPLPNFGTAGYGEYFTYVNNTASATVAGVSGPIGAFGSNLQEATMVSYPSGAATMAEPSSLEDGGTSFSVAWSNAGP